MSACQLAAAAAQAASEGNTSKAPGVLKEIAKLTTQFRHEQLQATVAQAALESLRMCEQHAWKCLNMLVDVLRAQEDPPDLMADAAWALHKLTQRCGVSRQWMHEAGTFAVVNHALLKHYTHSDLVQCCVGIAYNLDGLQGLSSLLNAGSGKSACLPDNVVTVIVWAAYDAVKNCNDRAYATTIMKDIVQLASQSHDYEVQQACCQTLNAMVHEDARLGALLTELGGVPLLLSMLLRAMNLGSSGQDLGCACANTVVSLAEASSMQAEVIRQHGGVEALAQFGMSGGAGSAEEAAIWALGHLDGLSTVLQAMARAPSTPAVIRGGLDAIAQLACSITAPSEVVALPSVLRDLCRMLEQMDRPGHPVKCRKKCLAAICGTMLGIAPHAEPGQVPELDEALQSILCVQTRDLSTEADIEIAENAVESLGRIALAKPCWREYLKHCGAVSVFKERIRVGHEHRRLLKYTFWAAAALSGLPFVCNELQLNMRSADTIDAAFCTIIDILDDDLEGDWVLKNAERFSDDALPNVLTLIADAMKGYLPDQCLQSRGCHCIGLLVALAPQGAVPPEAINAVFNASRHHARCAYVIRDVLYAFYCCLSRGREALSAVLREGGAEAVALQALADHAGDPSSAELLEEAVKVLCGLSGVRAALSALHDAGPGPVRTVGVKAIAEFGRLEPQLLLQCAEAILATIPGFAAEGVEDDALQQNAALLVGCCTWAAG